MPGTEECCLLGAEQREAWLWAGQCADPRHAPVGPSLSLRSDYPRRAVCPHQAGFLRSQDIITHGKMFDASNAALRSVRQKFLNVAFLQSVQGGPRLNRKPCTPGTSEGPYNEPTHHSDFTAAHLSLWQLK